LAVQPLLRPRVGFGLHDLGYDVGVQNDHSNETIPAGV
jgi:hypothetical protein